MANVIGTSGKDFIHVIGDGLTPPDNTWNAIAYTPDATNTITSGGNGGGRGDTFVGGSGGDTLDGGGGVDTASYATSHAAVNVSLTSGWGSGGEASGEHLISIENLVGSGFADTLTGNGAANTLDGLAGADTMIGAGANDTYVVDNAHDVTTETAASGGVDLVKSSVSRTLGANLENLTLTGIGAIAGTGNTLNNVITGNNAANGLSGLNGADTLSGGRGSDTLNGGNNHDTLTGGAGNDKFVFNAPVNQGHSDTITDFAHGDKIQLENSVFTGLGDATGTLAATKFYAGANAQDADDRILYDVSTGKLYYDEDGNATAHAKVLIATLTGHPALSASDIQVI